MYTIYDVPKMIQKLLKINYFLNSVPRILLTLPSHFHIWGNKFFQIKINKTLLENFNELNKTWKCVINFY